MGVQPESRHTDRIRGIRPGRPDPAIALRPFLKWAGGKRQLLPHLRQFYPREFRNYFEPFLGSGAVFFDLVNQGLLDTPRAALTDNNADLIGCYLRLRDTPGNVIRELKRLAGGYKKDPEAHFYKIRNDRFNRKRAALRDGGELKSGDYTASLAAMLIYLNRTGFNGLFRMNSKGLFNVPLGRYKNPTICDADNLQRVAATLCRRSIAVKQTTHDRALRAAKPGDFVYLDPPYAPLSATAHFTSYTAEGFSSDDQRQLQWVVVDLARRGTWVLLSNSTAPEVASLYDGNQEAEHAGLRAYKVPARRSINSDAARRGQIVEYIITNIPRNET